MRFVIMSLALYRLAQLVSFDDGPLWAFSRLRQWTDGKALAEQERGISRGPWQSLNDGLHCPLCTGIWLTPVVWFLAQRWYRLVYLLGVCGLQSFLERKS